MQTLREIRTAMKYSIREFAALLGFKNHSTYQHYESGIRPMPPGLMSYAQDAYKRDRRFFEHELPERISQVPVFMSEGTNAH